MLLIVHQFFLMTLSRTIIVFKPTLQTTNKFFLFKLAFMTYSRTMCFVFEVLSKEEDESWWAVRALKTDLVGFVPVSFLNHDQSQVTIMTTQVKRMRNSHVIA